MNNLSEYIYNVPTYVCVNNIQQIWTNEMEQNKGIYILDSNESKEKRLIYWGILYLSKLLFIQVHMESV